MFTRQTIQANPVIQSEINLLLKDWRNGQRSAFDRLITLLHDELKRLAHIQFSRERNNHTLETNDLVSRLYLKLLGSKTIPWENHTHFLNSALRTMRQIMIDHARGWAKRAGGKDKTSLSNVERGHKAHVDAPEHQLTQLLQLNQAIEKMADIDRDMAHIADLRLILGMTLEETSRELNLPINKVKREWLHIRQFLADSVWR